MVRLYMIITFWKIQEIQEKLTKFIKIRWAQNEYI